MRGKEVLSHKDLEGNQFPYDGRRSAQKSRPPLFAWSISDMLAIRRNVGHRRDEWAFHRAPRETLEQVIAFARHSPNSPVQEWRIGSQYGCIHYESSRPALFRIVDFVAFSVVSLPFSSRPHDLALSLRCCSST